MNHVHITSIEWLAQFSSEHSGRANATGGRFGALETATAGVAAGWLSIVSTAPAFAQQRAPMWDPDGSAHTLYAGGASIRQRYFLARWADGRNTCLRPLFETIAEQTTGCRWAG